MREGVSFTSRGLACRGWLYVPDDLPAGARAPGVVMAHGFSGVKELELPRFAEAFAGAGLVVLVFDYRFLGESEGEPRGQVLPWDQQEDYRNAVTWLARRPCVDPDRIGLWGTSYSGGHVLHLAAFDPRVKAVVSQVPAVGAWRQIVALGGLDALRVVIGSLLAERVAHDPEVGPRYVPVVAPPGEPSVLATPDAYEWFATLGRDVATWENRVTAESVERLFEYDAAGAIELVAPTPLLVIAAEHDALVSIDAVREAFGRAGEPKELLVLPCGHFDVYHVEPYHTRAVTAAADWFRTHLGAG